jgi:hypothetical protein
VSLIGNVIDLALSTTNIIAVVDNHTEAKTTEEKRKKRERRVAISDARNIGYFARRLLK